MASRSPTRDWSIGDRTRIGTVRTSEIQNRFRKSAAMCAWWAGPGCAFLATSSCAGSAPTLFWVACSCCFIARLPSSHGKAERLSITLASSARTQHVVQRHPDQRALRLAGVLLRAFFIAATALESLF